MELTQYLKELNKLNNLKENGKPNKKIEILLQTDNVKIGLYNDIINKVVEIWNKYENKQLGDKTKEKIKLEIEQTFDNKIFVYPHYNYIYITTRDASGKYNGDTNIKIITNHYEKKLTENNKILKLNVEDLREEEENTYTTNLTETANEIIHQHEKAKQLQEELNTIYRNINKLSNHKINSIQYTSSVSNWII